jgi:hypothetical protein
MHLRQYELLWETAPTIIDELRRKKWQK